MPYRWVACLSALLLVAFSGCTRPMEPTTPTLARIDARTPEEYNGLWEAAADTLRKQYFRLDRQDRTNGVLTTFPETSANWFELWRPQPTPGYFWWESNLSTIQRQVTVKFRPADEAGSYDVSVEVQRLRYRLTERQVDNPAAAQRLYSSGAPTAEGRRERQSQAGRWILLGRDEPLEQKLLNDIFSTPRVVTIVTTQPADMATP